MKFWALEQRWSGRVKSQAARGCACGWLAWIAIDVGVPASGQSPCASLYYYAIENLRTGEVVRRGTTGKQGIPPNGLILAPTTSYRESMLEAATGFVGFTDFTTPTSGLTFSIPPISLGLPQTPDADGDGLSDSAEFIVGTNPKLFYSNGDGVSDGVDGRMRMLDGSVPSAPDRERTSGGMESAEVSRGTEGFPSPGGEG